MLVFFLDKTMFRSVFSLRRSICQVNQSFSRSIILRQLDSKETSTITRKYDQTYVNKVRITSQVDLFTPKNLENLRKSIQKLKQLHPFLNCSIVKTGSNFYFNRLDSNEYSFENVKFLELDSYDDKLVDPNDASNYLLDLLNTYPISPESSNLAWRLAIFRLDKHEYDVMFDIHHSIIQARTSFIAIMRLFQFFEDLIKGVEAKSSTFEMYAGAEKVFANVKKLPPREDIPVIRVPSFMKASAANQTKSLKYSGKNINVVDKETGEVFKRLDWLEENSNRHHIRKHFFTVQPDLTARFYFN